MVPYIDQVVRSGYFHLRRISGVWRNLDDATCAAVIPCLVTSRLDYVNPLLYGVPERALHKLQVLENDAARVLSRAPHRDHFTPILRQLHWLLLRQRISHKVLSMVLHDDTAPTYLKQLLQPRRPARILRSSGALQLVEPRSWSTFYSRAFSIVGPKLWDRLPMDIRNVNSTAALHKLIKTVLFHQHFK